MALFLPAGVEAQTDEEKADLDAIQALRESAAYELKDQGNEFVKMGKKHYLEAIDCYTRAIDQKIADPQHNSVCYANRAHVHLLLGNNRRASEDAKEAMKLNDANIKAYFRGVKAALALGLLPEALDIAQAGLHLDPTNAELRKLGDKAKKLQDEEDAKKRRAAEALKEAERILILQYERESSYAILQALRSTSESCSCPAVIMGTREASKFDLEGVWRLATALEGRNVKVGRALYNHITRGRKPWLDKGAMMHWPVLLLHGEAMAADFIEDFFEMDMFNGHLDVAYGADGSNLPWDVRHEYTRKRVELYYQSNAGQPYRKEEVVQWLLEDDASRQGLDEDDNDDNAGFKKQQWVKVDERATLHSVLSCRDNVVPGIPVFYAVATGSSFYNSFLSGEWSPP